MPPAELVRHLKRKRSSTDFWDDDSDDSDDDSNDEESPSINYTHLSNIDIENIHAMAHSLPGLYDEHPGVYVNDERRIRTAPSIIPPK